MSIRNDIIQDKNGLQDEVTLFRWRVCTKGHEVAKQRPYFDEEGMLASFMTFGSTLQKQPILVLIEKETVADEIRIGAWPNQGQFRYYDPLAEEPGLFRRFADLPIDSPEAWREFADRFGLLGDGVCVATSRNEYPEREAELLDFWAHNVALMKAMVRLWSLWRDQQHEQELPEVLKPADDGNRYWSYLDPECPPPKGQYLPKKYFLDWYRRGGESYEQPFELRENHKGAVTAAAVILQRWVNERLSRHAQPALVYEPSTNRLILRLRPRTLLGAMWLQFAQAINEDDALHACASCGKWFVVNNAKDAPEAEAVLFRPVQTS